VALAHDHAPAHDRSMKTYFDHEKLDVYQEAITFCGWVNDIVGNVEKIFWAGRVFA
jgi:hypothetical protein